MKWTLPKACVEFGVARETIRKGLIQIGEEYKPGGSWSTKTIVRAIAGDGKVERARLTMAQADREEMEVAKMRREVLPLAEVVEVIRGTFQPIRDALVSLPHSLAARCNPSDPQMAMEALGGAVDNVLRALREDTLPTTIDGLVEEKKLFPDKRGGKRMSKKQKESEGMSD